MAYKKENKSYITRWDENGNYIKQPQDIVNKKAKLDNKDFKNRVEKFLNKHKILGTATTYGFNVTRNRLDNTIQKLNSLKIKYKLDYTNFYNVMIKISKKEI